MRCLAITFLSFVFAFPALGLAEAGAVDPLAAFEIPVTSGAAAGYVPDAVCGECHSDKWESFQQVGMGKSFVKADGAEVIERFDEDGVGRFYHEPSNRHYELWVDDGRYYFRRYQLNAKGQRTHVFETRVDWILGSGHHSRIYLYRTGSGELMQLPLSWYTLQGGLWEMAPGYEEADHLGVNRQVRHRCMACHNAFPDVPKGSDLEGMPQTYPVDLPEGIGCQRCHGPGAAHLRALYSEAPETEAIKAAIVNPIDLPRQELYGICYGCHMQPSVAVTPELRPGRGAYSFRPGEPLQGYKTLLDIRDETRNQSQRFDINHHPYRMEQSACFTQTLGQENALGCLTCHDPHRKVPVAERADHYRQICLSCHEVDARDLPVMASGEPHPDVDPQGECTSCHMPTRRTQDVIHTTMTDHRIQRDPGPLSVLVAPMRKRPAKVAAVTLLYPDQGLTPQEAEMAKLIGGLRYTSYKYAPAAKQLEALLRQMEAEGAVRGFEPWLVLTRSALAQQRYDLALVAAEKGLSVAPDNAMLLQQRAMALFLSGDKAAGRRAMEDLVARYPDFAIARYNLAVFLQDAGEPQAALTMLAPILNQSEVNWPAWRLKARIEAARGDEPAAIEAYLQALRIAPLARKVQDELEPLWSRAGRDPEALVIP